MTRPTPDGTFHWQVADGSLAAGAEVAAGTNPTDATSFP
jgi:hypothetical protein